MANLAESSDASQIPEHAGAIGDELVTTAPDEWSFTTSFDIGRTEHEAQLGIHNEQQVNRALITRDDVGDTSFWARLQRVQYGSHDGKPACLIVVDFSFRFIGKTLCRYNYAKIEVKFLKAVDATDHRIRSPEAKKDPVVVAIAPKEVYGIVKTVEGRKYREVSIPVMFESPLGLSTGIEATFGSEVSEHQEHRMEIHGDLYWDDAHDQGPYGAIWDLRENEAQKDGIFRSFRAAIVVESPAETPMWMYVVVEPSVKFSLDIRRLFTKTDPFAKLFQKSDHPILLDGKKTLGLPIGPGLDFTSKDFPWHKVVWLPSEYKSQLLSQFETTDSGQSSTTTAVANNV